MHFDASDPLKKKMMDLVSSANDVCIVFGICDHLVKVNHIDPQSQRNTVLVVLPPRIPETFNLFDNMQLKIPPVMLRQGTSQEEHHFLTMLGMQTEEDWRQRDTSSYFWIMKQPGQLLKERTNLQKKNLFDCVKIADYAEIQKIGEFLQRRPSRNSAAKLSIPCGEVDRPASVEGGQLLRRIRPGSRIGSIEEIGKTPEGRSATFRVQGLVFFFFERVMFYFVISFFHYFLSFFFSFFVFLIFFQFSTLKVART